MDVEDVAGRVGGEGARGCVFEAADDSAYDLWCGGWVVVVGPGYYAGEERGDGGVEDVLVEGVGVGDG